MITISKDEEGKVVAFIEWAQVGMSGIPRPGGYYLWINEFWIHEKHRGKECFRDLVAQILSVAPDARYCYFTRAKYGHRMSKLYKRKKFEQLIEKENQRKEV